MAFYAIDLKSRVIQQVAKHWKNTDATLYFFIEAACAKQAWDKCRRWSGEIGASDCARCRHTRCEFCEECSVAKQYSDYWICHSCSELNLRVSSNA